MVLLTVVELGSRLYWAIGPGVPFFPASEVSSAFDNDDLREIMDQGIRPDNGVFDVLLLGGSVLRDSVANVGVRLEEELQRRTKRAVTVHNASSSSSTISDSYRKYGLLESKKFDLVVVYHGLNRAYDSEYSRELEGLTDHAEVGWLVFPYIAHRAWSSLKRMWNDGADTSAGELSGRSQEVGYVVPRADMPEKHLRGILEIAHTRGERVLLMTFAHGPNRGGFATREERALALSSIRGYNKAVLDQRARKTQGAQVLFINQSRLLSRKSVNFVDLCHLTATGSAKFIDAISTKIAPAIRTTDDIGNIARGIRPRFRPPANLLLVILDATAARRWSLYGYDTTTTRFLDSIEEQSIVFDSAYSQSTSTGPSTWSYFTGRYPFWPDSKPGVVHPIRRGKDAVLATAFHDAGFATAGFSENPFVRSNFGHDSGFDDFKYTDSQFKMAAGDYARDHAATETVLRNAQKWIASMGDGRWFCYVHLLRPHNPYLAPEPFRGRFLEADVPGENAAEDFLRQEEERIVKKGFFSATPKVSTSELDLLVDLYEGSIAYTDELMRRLVAFLNERGLLDTTLVIVTSDHGEAFLEHGQLLHTREPYEELIHVPLVVLAPETTGFVRGRIGTLVELVDLFPTFRDVFGLDLRQELDGTSLFGLLRGETTEIEKEYSFADAGSISVRKGDRKLLVRIDKESGTVIGYELYDLAADPAEKNDLFTTEGQTADLIIAARRYLRTRQNGKSFSMPRMTAEEIEHLRALGYVQ